MSLDPRTPTIRTETPVMFFDTDCAGVVHNIAYLRFIETARTLLAQKMGLGLKEMALGPTFPVVARTEIDYRRPVRMGDSLIVEGALDTIERMRFWCAFRILRASDGVEAVASRQMLAFVDLAAGKPVPLPSAWLESYAHLRRKRVAEGSAPGTAG